MGRRREHPLAVTRIRCDTEQVYSVVHSGLVRRSFRHGSGAKLVKQGRVQATIGRNLMSNQLTKTA